VELNKYTIGRKWDESPGLPDGIFSNQKYPFGYILEILAMTVVGIHILWPFRIFLLPFGIFCVLVYFSRFGTFYEEKSGNPVNHN
jgi:hypothetical protein